MLTHYLKIAFRNIRKYTNQTLISVVGLAAGFTCFALSMLWIRYEMTFDGFHKDAEQIYVVYTPSASSQTGYSRMTTPHLLAAHLKETFPEVAYSTALNPGYRTQTATVDGVELPMLTMLVDSEFVRMFDVKIIDGSSDFLIPDSRKAAVTDEKARKLFGNEDPIGKTVIVNFSEHEICAIVSGMSKQSNYPFDFLIAQPNYAAFSPNTMFLVNVIIKLHHGTNIEAFEKKLYEHDAFERFRVSNMMIKPLTKMRYLDSDTERKVKFQHILIFALCGLLVALSSLFNYLTLFVSRFRMRQKEFALRIVCGASLMSLFAMLSVEFVLTMLFAVVAGCALTQLAYKPFVMLSDIQINLSAIYGESLVYTGGVILISLFVFWLILFIFRYRSLNISIRRSNKKLFRKASVVSQLVISIGFSFCSIVILKQIYFLHNTNELGFSFKNSGSIMAWGENDVLLNRLRQIPEITEAFYAAGVTPLLPQTGRSSRMISSWDDKPADIESVSLEQMFVTPEYISFYDLRLVDGETLTAADPESLVLISENAAVAFGWHDPIGKRFGDKYTVKGVIKQVYNFAPTMPTNPVFYVKPPHDGRAAGVISFAGTEYTVGNILFKYHEGTWSSCKEKIEDMKTEFRIMNFYNAEEIYDGYLKSEKNLIKLLSIVSSICVLICLFGFVSLVLLTCEERRKSIAIRKVHGATSGDILAMFAKEYFLMLIIGTVIAFSAGFLIMQRWLENYAVRSNIPAWIYFSIIGVFALMITLFVGWRAYKSSIENPAEVLKTE